MLLSKIGWTSMGWPPGGGAGCWTVAWACSCPLVGGWGSVNSEIMKPILVMN